MIGLGVVWLIYYASNVSYVELKRFREPVNLVFPWPVCFDHILQDGRNRGIKKCFFSASISFRQSSYESVVCRGVKLSRKWGDADGL